MDSALLANFMSMTGTNESEASMWLEMAGNDSESAINMFFNNSSDGAASNNSANMGYVGGAGMTGTAAKNPSNFSAHGTGIDNYNGSDFGEPQLRAADAQKLQRLMPVSPSSNHIVADNRVRTVFQNTGSNAPFVPKSAREKNLAELFKPPTSIMCRGSFDDAKAFAKQQDKWLLVNIQSDEIFACHSMNRDVWSDATIQEVVQQSFVFWQQEKGNKDGHYYLSLYKILAGAGDTDVFPHVAILDPRTGRNEKTLKVKRTKNVESMAECLMDFLGSNGYTPSSGDGTSAASYASTVPSVFNFGAGGMSSAGTMEDQTSGVAVAQSPEGMDEEDAELQKALAMSMHANTNSQHTTSDSTAVFVVDDDAGSSDTAPSEPKAGFMVSLSDPTTVRCLLLGNDWIACSSAPKATDGPKTKVQFVVPGGKKLVQAFFRQESVNSIVNFAAEKLVEWSKNNPSDEITGGSVRFDLSYGFPKAVLLSEVLQQANHSVTPCSIDSCQLGALTVNIMLNPKSSNSSSITDK